MGPAVTTAPDCRCDGTGCRLWANDPRHGTHNGYHNLGCRCRTCTEANRVWNRARIDRIARERTCPNCGGPGGAATDGACHACSAYRRIHGVDRPRELYDPQPRTCANCREVVPPGKPRRWGRCDTCAKYLDRNGRERPARLYAKETTDA